MVSTPDDAPTCGKGLAAHSVLPARLGELMAAMGDVLRNHRRSLMLTDPAARLEDRAYESLADEMRTMAEDLDALARRMAAHRDLPMGLHDETALGDRASRDVFAALARVERELLDLLQASVTQNDAMLAEWSA